MLNDFLSFSIVQTKDIVISPSPISEPAAVSLRKSGMRRTDTESNAWGRWQQEPGDDRCQLVEPLSNFAHALPHKHRRQCQPSTPPHTFSPLDHINHDGAVGKTIRTRPKRGEVKCAIGEGLKIDKTCHTRPVFKSTGA